MMEIIREFLESASINGLNHIAATRKWSRAFWILIVITGFFGGSYITWESFQSWADNPVRTTTKTLPMSEIKFPKVTVCPPKNTFTDINYDLMIAENVSLTDETKNELYENIIELIDENVYMDLYDKVHEENRFYNWYYGFTPISSNLPQYIRGDIDYKYMIVTSAPSGVITSKHFGENFHPNLIEKSIQYWIKLHPARSVFSNENVTLHIEIEKVTSKNLETRFDAFWFDDTNLKRDVTFFQESFTPPGRNLDTWMPYRSLRIIQVISDSDINEMDTDDQMPGFRFTWYYTGMEFTPEPLMEFPEIEYIYEYSKSTYMGFVR